MSRALFAAGLAEPLHILTHARKQGAPLQQVEDAMAGQILAAAMASIALPEMGKRMCLRLCADARRWHGLAVGLVIAQFALKAASQTRRQDSGHGRFTLSSFLFLSHHICGALE